jgi:RNA polymerase sigma factor (sigma-70 family)
VCPQLQVDVKFIEPLGQTGRRRKFYQFTAIDACTRLRVLRAYPRRDQGRHDGPTDLAAAVANRPAARLERAVDDRVRRRCRRALLCPEGLGHHQRAARGVPKPILSNIGRRSGAREARTVPWSSLGPADDPGAAVDPDRFRGSDDQWPRHWTPLGKPRPWLRSPEDEITTAETRSQLENGLAGLPERQRSVVVLRDVHGLSSDEVCSLLGLSAANQRVLLHRGRSRLRGLLEMHYTSGQPVMGT